MSIQTTADRLQKVIDTKNAQRDYLEEKGVDTTNIPFENYVGEFDKLIEDASGSGESQDNTTLNNLLNRSITDFVVPNDVTSIGKYTFCECRSLNNIIFHNNFTNIEAYAFLYCKSLTNIVLPNSIVYIGAAVFQMCEGLTNIVLPKNDNFTRLLPQLFVSCTSLTNLTIPSSVTSIEKQALQIGSTTNKATITFESTTPATIVTDVFIASKLEAIRVPVSAVDTYKTATNWSAWADYIVGY